MVQCTLHRMAKLFAWVVVVGNEEKGGKFSRAFSSPTLLLVCVSHLFIVLCCVVYSFYPPSLVMRLQLDYNNCNMTTAHPTTPSCQTLRAATLPPPSLPFVTRNVVIVRSLVGHPEQRFYSCPLTSHQFMENIERDEEEEEAVEPRTGRRIIPSLLPND